MDIFCYKSCFKSLALEDEVLQFKSACGCCVSKCLQEHSAVVKKEFRLRKAFNFFKNAYKIKHWYENSTRVAICSLVMSPYPHVMS